MKDSLRECFARYDREDLIHTLKGSMRLFARLSREIAEHMEWSYPCKAEETAAAYLEERFPEDGRPKASGPDLKQ